MRKYRLVVSVVALGLLCAQGPLSAQDEELLQRVRLSVASYELGEGGIVDVVGELSQKLSAGQLNESTAREVRFLRAAASADLMFIAAYTNDANLRERVAAAWAATGSPREAVAAELAQAEGIYRVPAARIAKALELLGADGAILTEGLSARKGSWRDIVLLRVAARAVAGGAPDGLVGLARDPCAGIKRGCDALFMTFDSDSRTALAGLREVGAAVKRLRAARSQGDPLVNALSDSIEDHYTRLTAVELRLSPMLRPEVHVHAEGDKPNRMPVDLLVMLHDDSLKYGYVPRISLGADGELVPRAVGEPALPGTATVEFPGEFTPYMRPMSEVVEALSPTGIEPTQLSLGVTVATGVRSHILGRVLLSVRRAGFEEPAIIGPGRYGGALGVPLRVLAAREADALRPQPQVKVRVRLGGYSLRMGFGLTDIPRVRGDGGFSFDTEALQARVSRRRIRSAAVSFMGNVAVENLLSAVWRVAPDKDPLNIVVP